MPNSLSQYHPTRLGFLSQGHLCQILVRTNNLPFHGLLGFAGYTSLRFAQLLTITALHWPIPLKRRDGAALHTRKRQLNWLFGTGMLTSFPFDVLELRYILGPTDPRLTNIAEET